ncbi:hypothetical protein H257_11366 [Aphanomyces astaci]|uniref:Uncharacterized protein n=1 Tax=Aphanomyces astaci TaxID=112090 RepID=W4G4W7_APHAT|nr:hypothetical protein H257_11366 [Aphanomyces astaci]ETV74054.1 hypothetical protein H257_11366 [Aphanomyces astaci]|eukprot:XP_009836567.1 hypothetical protein H257_11366 [Aphanomyces astaci]
MSLAPRSTRELTPDIKMEVVFALQDAIYNGKLACGSIQATAIRCQVGRATVRKIWRDFKSSVPARDRSTMRDMASSTGISFERLAFGRAHKVVPSIKERFPSRSKRVVLQHDNATPHGSIDEDALAAVSTDGWTFVVRRQPPNSPDLNVLDLGFFASIQSLQYKMVSRSMDDVIDATLSAFEVLSSDKLSSIFLTLQAVMRLVMEHHGDNNFKLPHLKKDTLRRAGTLMANVTCPASLLFHVISFLQQSSP